MASLTRDGVILTLDDVGAGGLPLVLVHGMACDRQFMAPQLRAFSAAHRVVSFDLRGHGESDAPHQEYTIDGFADDVLWMCDRLQISQPVIIGHSIGGIVALALAARRPDWVRGIVAIDSVLTPPADRAPMMIDLLARVGADYPASLRAYFAAMMGPDDPRWGRWVLDRITATPQHVVMSTWENGFFGFDSGAAAALCRAPFLYIDAGTPNADLDELVRLCPAVVLERVEGHGHFVQLEAPEAVNAVIAAFLATIP